uniref:Uncharacterized protein n=1 Tax=Cryptomonas curvata TaxID=233186 RepID=A0A7S0MED4_9CRYP|mmetsp:Transcript_37238/g.77920  ORF Transcript_37238/g.77920 Transcript_37238/m.77920 type:complete len:159 (+) Transcript_37238:69-545(+)
MWIVQKLLDCLPCNIPFLKRTDPAKKTDSASTPDKSRSFDNLEAGVTEDGWEFDNWENKPRQPSSRPVSVSLQKLDDFDGMAPVKNADEAPPEPDFFGNLGLKPQYQPPKQIEVKRALSAKSLWTPNDEDEDIDIEGWESGKVRKPKKKLSAMRVPSA